MRFFYFFLLLLIINFSNAQVSINPTNAPPDGSAMLDVQSDNKGVLIPRLLEAQRISISAPAPGLLVFQTDGVSGFYYYFGNEWLHLTEGVLNITPNTIPKWDGQKLSNSELVETGGNVGVGTSSPGAKLDINGQIRIQGGNPGANKVLTSDAGGTGSWQTLGPTVLNTGNGLNWSGNTLNSTWTQSGNNIFNNNAGNVGIGTNNPLNSLEVVGNAVITDTLEVGARIKDKTGFIMPVGTILAYGGDNIPEGWLLCDGDTISRIQYADLFDAIGTAWGSGNGTTTFHLPDLRGRFTRGVDGNGGNDPDKTSRMSVNSGGNTGNNVGSLQNDSFLSHNHNGYTGYDGQHTHTPSANFTVKSPSGAGTSGIPNASGWGTYTPAHWFSVSTEPNHHHSINSSGSGETRSKNVYVNYIIKY